MPNSKALTPEQQKIQDIKPGSTALYGKINFKTGYRVLDG